MPPDDTDGLDDADLPGLDDAAESDAPWPRFSEGYGAVGPDGEPMPATTPPTSDPARMPDDVWVEGEDPHSVIGDLAPYGPDYAHPPKPSLPQWIWVGAGFGILGLVLTVGFFVSSGDADDGAVAVPSDTPVVETAPPSTGATVVDTEAPAVAVGVPGVSAVPFPTSWTYTATKTASIVPAPDFITPTPVGAVLPWAFNLTETCQQQVCTYVTAISPLIPDPLFPAPPETTWVVVDTGWSLDVTYLSGQSSYGDGTICAIRNHDTFDLTVTNEVINGRSIPTAFTGTWVQSSSLDLGASTGNVDFYCGDFWEVVDEWSLVGVAG